MTEDRYWCTECFCFVEKDHRCEQWSNTIRIPGEAIKAIKIECAKNEHEAIPLVLEALESEIMGQPLDPEVQDCIQKNFWELAGKE